MEVLDIALKIALLVLTVTSVVVVGAVGFGLVTILRTINRTAASFRKTTGEAKDFFFNTKSITSLLSAILSFMGLMRAASGRFARKKDNKEQKK